MEYTLDTAAIRRRFEQAIIGIHPDGCMAILLEQATGDIYIDIVSGGRCAEINLTDVYTTLIRPGDRCECRATDDYDWDGGTFNGFSGDYDFPFRVVVADCIMYVGYIRPLPAAETNPLLTRLAAAEQELAAIRTELNQVQK